MKRKQKTNLKSLKADVFDTFGVKVGRKISLPTEIFGVVVSPALISQAIRVYLVNQRKGTHSTKSRGEVSGSKRKIYRQKGTGRARHGARQAPIFRGGGIVHGPRVKKYSLSLPKKQKRLALFGALSNKLQEGKIMIVKDLDKIEAKTKQMVGVLGSLKVVNGKSRKQSKILLIIPEKRENISLASRNINYLSIAQAGVLNSYTVTLHHQLIFMEESIEKLKSVYFGKKKNDDFSAGKEEDKLSTKQGTKIIKKKKLEAIMTESASSQRPSKPIVKSTKAKLKVKKS